VLQGEREMARDNKSLGMFHLTGIPPAPRGVPQIEVTFDLDANGILHASARDRASGREQSITITGSSNLSKEDIERMVREAEQYAEQDRRAREEAEERNKAEQLAYSAEKTLKDLGDNAPPAEREAAQAAIDRLRDALKGSDIEQIRRAADELRDASYRLSELLYKQAASSGSSEAGATSAAGSGTGGEEVIDAEYKEEN
jgi:molecular chaperone DnaK